VTDAAVGGPAVSGPLPVVVTGAAGGLGAAAVRRLATGRRVIACDLDSPALRALAGDRVEVLPLDVTDAAAVAAFGVQVAVTAPALAAVVHFAGILEVGPLVEIDDEALRRVLDVNVLGTARVTKALFPLLLAGRGRVVLLSSETGWQPAMPFNGPYAVSKHAVEAYGDSLRRELMLLGLAVVKIQPGAFRTGMVASIMDRFEAVAARSEHFGPALRMARARVPQEERRAGDPDDLAALVARVLEAPRPRPAYRINTNPMAAALARLPERALDRLLLAGLRRGR
jgi:NAD(P)-dependent dehydrogenase (short-subunit alcohol dehydrogenase family)